MNRIEKLLVGADIIHSQIKQRPNNIKKPENIEFSGFLSAFHFLRTSSINIQQCSQENEILHLSLQSARVSTLFLGFVDTLKRLLRKPFFKLRVALGQLEKYGSNFRLVITIRATSRYSLIFLVNTRFIRIPRMNSNKQLTRRATSNQQAINTLPTRN